MAESSSSSESESSVSSSSSVSESSSSSSSVVMTGPFKVVAVDAFVAGAEAVDTQY